MCSNLNFFPNSQFYTYSFFTRLERNTSIEFFIKIESHALNFSLNIRYAFFKHPTPVLLFYNIIRSFPLSIQIRRCNRYTRRNNDRIIFLMFIIDFYRDLQAPLVGKSILNFFLLPLLINNSSYEINYQ